MKLSFKKQPKTTGRAGIGHPYSSTDILGDKKDVGIIVAPNWQTKDNLWRVRFVVEKNEVYNDGNKNCPWMWVGVKARFETEAEAREWVKANWDAIQEKFPLFGLER